MATVHGSDVISAEGFHETWHLGSGVFLTSLLGQWDKRVYISWVMTGGYIGVHRCLRARRNNLLPFVACR